MAELEGVWVYTNADLLVMRPLPAYSINDCECQEQSNTYWSLVRLYGCNNSCHLELIFVI